MSQDTPSLITRLLGNRSDPPPESAQVRAALEKIAKRQKEIEQRREAIRPAWHGEPIPGPERERVLRQGSPRELVELDEEIEQLVAEKQQLSHRHEILLKKLEEAERNEAKKELPDLLKTLPAACDELEAARKAAEKAGEVFRSRLDEVTTAVRRAEPPPDFRLQELAGRVCDLLGIKESEKGHTYSTARSRWFEQLGAGPTPRAAKSNGLPHPENDESKQKDGPTEDFTTRPEFRSRHPEHSIWDRKEPGRSD